MKKIRISILFIGIVGIFIFYIFLTHKKSASEVIVADKTKLSNQKARKQKLNLANEIRKQDKNKNIPSFDSQDIPLPKEESRKLEIEEAMDRVEFLPPTYVYEPAITLGISKIGVLHGYVYSEDGQPLKKAKLKIGYVRKYFRVPEGISYGDQFSPKEPGEFAFEYLIEDPSETIEVQWMIETTYTDEHGYFKLEEMPFVKLAVRLAEPYSCWLAKEIYPGFYVFYAKKEK